MLSMIEITKHVANFYDCNWIANKKKCTHSFSILCHIQLIELAIILLSRRVITFYLPAAISLTEGFYCVDSFLQVDSELLLGKIQNRVE